MRNFPELIHTLKESNNIVITTHLIPDADGIGSEIALCLALKKLGKNVICCNDEPLLERYRYLDPHHNVVGHDQLKEKFEQTPELIVVVDTNTIERTGHKLTTLAHSSGADIIYIDHHPCKQHGKNGHYIDTSAAATGQMVGELIKEMQIEIDPYIALPLYTAILIDTSSFRYPTVTADTHQLIAELMSTGIKPPLAYNGIYGAKKIEHMHLLGKVLSNASLDNTGSIAWIVLTADELEEYDVDIEDTHGFINNLLILDKVKITCMFRDDGDRVKVSLRSTSGLDVGSVAINLGGGGHSHSAATIIYKENGQDLDLIIKNVISKIQEAVL